MRLPRESWTAWCRVLAGTPAGCIALALCAIAGSAAPTHAALRSPQVAVSGTALQSFFATQGQGIAVNGAQQDLQRFSQPAGSSLLLIPFGASGAEVGVYNASAVTPSLYSLLPNFALPGWTALASFRSAPDQLVANLFDAGNNSQGVFVYPGADRTDFGFYALAGSALAFSLDLRNAGGRAQMLAFSGTGARSGSLWLAFEFTPGPGGDYADAIALLTFTGAPVGVRPGGWSRVKALYR